jgi:hypothetical protein
MGADLDLLFPEVSTLSFAEVGRTLVKSGVSVPGRDDSRICLARTLLDGRVVAQLSFRQSWPLCQPGAFATFVLVALASGLRLLPVVSATQQPQERCP